jgi:hypothetical protein
LIGPVIPAFSCRRHERLARRHNEFNARWLNSDDGQIRL